MFDNIEPKLSISRVPQKVKNGISVYTRVHYKGSDVKLSTGIVVKPINWNTKKKSIKGNIKLSNQLDQNEYFIKIKFKELITEYPQLHLSNINKIFKGNYRGSLKSNTPKVYNNSIYQSEVTTLPKLINMYIESKSKPNTKSNAKSLKANIVRFMEQSKMNDIPIQSYNKRIFSEFKDFLEFKELSNNYVERTLNMLKTILNWGISNNLDIDINFPRYVSEIKNLIVKDTPPMIALFKDEFKKIVEYDPNVESLSKIKDAYVFMVRTGQRLSDYLELDKDSITYNKVQHLWYWELRQKKTTKQVIVPLREDTYEILNKYNFKLPLNSNSNNNLKKLAELVGLDREIVESKTRNGKLFTNKFELHEIISLHSSRKTFVTIGIQTGNNDHTITKITGHSSINEYKKYVETHSDDINKLINSI